ncbi:hypothetical protein ACJRO7_020063 [Eucalyptus globulus]|uniref:Uncharacterized protein n=1 Tax=Eucalyptus globulus TaxID=34317 RepID=A0ABD3KM31_EUCGL
MIAAKQRGNVNPRSERDLNAIQGCSNAKERTRPALRTMVVGQRNGRESNMSSSKEGLLPLFSRTLFDLAFTKCTPFLTLQRGRGDGWRVEEEAGVEACEVDQAEFSGDEEKGLQGCVGERLS